MSKTFNAYYFANPERYEQEQGYRQRKMEEAWRWYEEEQMNAQAEEPEQRFILTDGTILFTDKIPN